ncbi:biotin--[acetyl-CoA-carboxylase] ligase [Parasphingopyxis lamellibrachiae]|uniref:biotin--[acetyl-CoA-carboxylase] ligase n=1 Tax=Parasphingopyxis lamellibrachiae TaxID=680125 RepID=UPI000E26F27D|nr:biotin--[acetyl-CoA-carboxylase] ligase [Parasphingopyxis lamellibrachiae]
MQTVAETGSTNDDVMALARAGEAEGFWLRADRQLAGRGRQGRNWVSPSGNLFASTLVRTGEGDPPSASLALVASLALYDAVAAFLGEEMHSALTLKWPNDLLLDGAKLSGILLERENEAVVIGIGVNLVGHPDNLDRPATSLAAYGMAPMPDIFLRELADSFAKWVAKWREPGLGAIREQWLARAHPRGAALTVHDPSGRKIDGVFDGMDADGALRLRLADGAVHVMHAGDVFLI